MPHYNQDLQSDNIKLNNIYNIVASLPDAIDLSSDTVTPDTLFKDKTAHDKSSKVITGTFSIDNELNEQNNIMDSIEQALVGKGLPDTSIKKEIAGQATITENGTQQFTPPADSVYNLFTTTVNVPQPSTQEKTINISQNGQVIVTPDKDKLLSKVTVITDTPVPKIEQSVEKIIKTNGITTIQPDVGKVLKEVSVNVQVPSTPIQEKTININTNGQTVVTPNQGFNLSKVLINTNVAGSNGTQAIELTLPNVKTKFSSSDKIAVWGWGADGTDWTASLYIFCGTYYMLSYLGAEQVNMVLSLNTNGEVQGLPPNLIQGQILVITL